MTLVNVLIDLSEVDEQDLIEELESRDFSMIDSEDTYVLDNYKEELEKLMEMYSRGVDCTKQMRKMFRDFLGEEL